MQTSGAMRRENAAHICVSVIGDAQRSEAHHLLRHAALTWRIASLPRCICCAMT